MVQTLYANLSIGPICHRANTERLVGGALGSGADCPLTSFGTCRLKRLYLARGAATLLLARDIFDALATSGRAPSCLACQLTCRGTVVERAYVEKYASNWPISISQIMFSRAYNMFVPLTQ